MEFAYAGGGLGKGGKVSLYVDGKKDGEGTVAATAAMVFSADDGCDVGEDYRSARLRRLRSARERVHGPGERGADRYIRRRRGRAAT